MKHVIFKGERYEVDSYDRLILSGQDIEKLNELEGFEELRGIKSLSLQHNKISEIKLIGHFSELESLFLYSNEIKEIKGLDKLTNLKRLILNDNKISKIQGLDELKNLIELNLGNNRIKKIEGLTELTKLELLDLQGNKIKIIQGLDFLINLNTLYLNHNQIAEIQNLEGLAKIRKLYLDSNQISQVKGLQDIEDLVYLRIGNNPIPLDVLEELGGLDGDAAKDPNHFINFSIQQFEEEMLHNELSEEKGEIKEEIKQRLLNFDENLRLIERNWEDFRLVDTYLTNEKKLKIFSALKDIMKFPFYFKIRYPFKLKRIKSKVSDFKIKIEDHNPIFIQNRLIKYKRFFDGTDHGIKYPLDEDQRMAVIKDDKHNLVIAGAGSGKTSVITNRIAYLIKRQDAIKPDRILALAFTNVAAKEMQERLELTYGLKVNISTFHALGRKIIIDETNHYPNLIENDKNIIYKIYKDLLATDVFQGLLLDYLCYHNEEEVEEEDFEDKELYFKYMRNKKYTSLNNINVKSQSENDIANFMFRNGISFEYEPLVEWPDEDVELGRKYHPDFYLPDYDIYIEHWGLNRNREVPDWFEGTSEDYLGKREWKLEQFRKHKKTLVETWEYERIEGVLIEKLKEKLIEVNPSIRFIPLSYEQLVEDTSEFEVKKKDILDLIISFIQIAKSNYLFVDDILKKLKSRKYSRKQRAFGKMAVQVYESYQKNLRKKGQIDFNDMINLAIDLIKRNPEKYLKMYDHVLIDEFQDISYQRMELINCFINDKSKTKLFCVGDDWQSIYQFTGSDVRFFVNFKEYFASPELSFLKRNYRSAQNIVALSNHVISKNKNQIRKEAYSKAGLEDKQVLHFEINDVSAGLNNIPAYYIYQLVNSLLSLGVKPEEIMVLSRFNKNLRDAKVFCGAQNIPIEEMSSRGATKGVRFYSAHKSKGSESKYVILTDLTSGLYGFPCEIKDSSVFDPAKRFSSKEFIEEERRLFYVALTRSKQFLFLLSLAGNPSVFLGEIQSIIKNVPVGSKGIWDDISSQFIPKFVRGLEASKAPRFCEQCGGIFLERAGNFGPFFGCSNYPNCKNTFTPAENDSEKCPRCGRKLVERNGKHGKFLSCTGYPNCRYTKDLKTGEGIPKCPKCGRRLILRDGPYGKFISCTGYPNCRFSRSSK